MNFTPKQGNKHQNPINSTRKQQTSDIKTQLNLPQNNKYNPMNSTPPPKKQQQH